ncbi:unnamed protein product [Allacma fusca]|uniref:Gustatory receptor n=1 Tax=Allacma fusca TaxID=39272 RepID=A0A8J2KPW8_9HEXA|nr:unnamed protein product [Allacma fusca]
MFSRDKSAEETEDYIISVFHLAIRAAQWIGVVELDIARRGNRRYLSFKNWNMLKIYSIVTSILVIPWVRFYYIHEESLLKSAGVSSPTQYWAFLLEFYFLLCCLMYVRLVETRKGIKAVVFWRKFISLISFLKVLDEKVHWDKLRTTTRNRMAFVLVYLCLASVTAISSGMEIARVSLILIWVTVMSSYQLFTHYLGAFIQSYGICLKRIGKDMEALKPCHKGTEGHVNAEKMEDFMRKYYLVDDQVQEFSAEYGVALTMHIAWNTAIVLVYSFFIVIKLNGGQFETLFWYAPMTIEVASQLLILVENCMKIEFEAKKIGFLLQQLEFKELPGSTLMKVRLFALKIYTNPVSVSPWKLFRINRTLVNSLTAYVTLYLILFVQFEATDVRRIASNGNSTILDSVYNETTLA